MNRWYLLLPLTLLGCGPSASDFVGSYPVAASEELSNCDNASSTDLAFVDEVTITEAADPDSATPLVLEVGRCTFNASLIEDPEDRLRMSVGEQNCTVSIDEPEAIIEVFGEGEVAEGGLTLLLSGTYTSSTYGLPFTCDYNLALAPGG